MQSETPSGKDKVGLSVAPEHFKFEWTHLERLILNI